LTYRILMSLVALGVLHFANAATAQDTKIRHVLLISVDGLHALDVSNYVANHPHSAFTELAGHGVTYTNAHARQFRLFSRTSRSGNGRLAGEPWSLLRRQL